MKNNNKKHEQLGMPIGTASNRLKKSIIFHLIKKANENFCYQCGLEIETEEHLSIEHKVPYLDSLNPIELFFDIENIAFSHLNCNIGAARKTIVEHGMNGYFRGCRCEICKEANYGKIKRYRKKKAGIAQSEVR